MSLREALKLMVVDDMSTSRGLITQSLNDIGLWNIQTENDGRAALATLSAKPVHLVLSDMNMPGMDGLGLLQALRQNQATQRIGFILVTGTPTQDILKKGQSLGLNNFIKKPFSAKDMKLCIEKVVGKF
ncbi:response regulator [Litoreibacter roseus]|uniref:Response regulator n=1 Tax=Litoreibacter roseus TaxID=2601869 RepID=A0A6N6JHE9_9RHOB|nr:response regulator [Litoreibacter roseus]GFE64809.1 response regulator [Litoreibacter roseus]